MRQNMRRLLPLLCTFSLGFCFLPVNAEGEDFTNTDYWNNLCTNTSSLTSEQQESCAAYMQYMSSQNAALQQQIAGIDSRKEEINENIEYYAGQISSYNAQIEDLNYMIADLNNQIADAKTQIADMQTQINDSQVQIDEKNKEIDDLKKKVANRMVEEQQGMRTYKFLDVLMGSTTFDQFIRVANGLSDISAYDTRTLQQLADAISALNDLMDQLNSEKDELSQMEADLESGMSELNNQQTQLLSAKYEVQTIQASYQEQLNTADSERRAALASISINSNAIGNISDSITSSRSNQADQSNQSTPTPSASAESGSSSSSTPSESTPVPLSTPTPAISTPKPQQSGPTYGDSSGNPYWGGWANCTWGAWQIAHDTLGVSLPRWGNAGQWLSNAAASGYATGSEPRVNSIWVTSWHVAYVTAVDGDRVYIREGNYLGRYNERWVSARNCLGFVYL